MAALVATTGQDLIQLAQTIRRVSANYRTNHGRELNYEECITFLLRYYDSPSNTLNQTGESYLDGIDPAHKEKLLAHLKKSK